MHIFVDPCFDQVPPPGNYPPPPPGLAQVATRRDFPVGGTVIAVWTGGQPGHLDWLQAILHGAGIVGQGSPPNQTVRNQLRAFGRPNDDAGHIIAANLGGPGNQLWNFFPQTLNINRGSWPQQEQICANALNAGRQVRVCFRFTYGNAQEPNRPTSFDYCYKLIGGTMIDNLVNP